MLLNIGKTDLWRRRAGANANRAEGRSMAVFVPFVLPGEHVEAEIAPGKAGFARDRFRS